MLPQQHRLFPLLLVALTEVCVEDTAHFRYRMQRNKASTELDASSSLPERNMYTARGGICRWLVLLTFHITVTKYHGQRQILEELAYTGL